MRILIQLTHMYSTPNLIVVSGFDVTKSLAIRPKHNELIPQILQTLD